MKPCRNTPQPHRAAGTAGPPPSSTVNRYSHPILVKGSRRPSSTEELLSYILETLSHQGDLLEELLRRSAEAETDTI